MQDRRIIKTKKNIKNALISLLAEKNFEKISVTEICDRAKVSRISFYAHYKDKYELVEFIFSDYVREAYHDYRLMQKENVDNDPLRAYDNLLESILNLYFKNIDFFTYATATKNPYLYSLFYSHMFGIVRGFVRSNKDFMPKYHPRQTAAFLCNGFWGMISECNAEKVPEETTRANVKALCRDLLESDVFNYSGE